MSLLLPTRSALLLLTRHAPSCRVDACTTLSSVAVGRCRGHLLWRGSCNDGLTKVLLSNVLFLEEGSRQEEWRRARPTGTACSEAVGGDKGWQPMQAMSDPARAGDVVKMDVKGTHSSTNHGMESW